MGWHPRLQVRSVAFTGVSLYLAGRYHLLKTSSNYAADSILGRRSYSLYISRPDRCAVHVILSRSDSLVFPYLRRTRCYAWLAAVIVSLIGASLLYQFVERPSLRLSRTLGPKSPALAKPGITSSEIDSFQHDTGLLLAAVTDHGQIRDRHVTVLGVCIHAVLFHLLLRVFLHPVGCGIFHHAGNLDRMPEMFV